MQVHTQHLAACVRLPLARGAANNPAANRLALAETRQAAQVLGVQVHALDVGSGEDLSSAFAATARLPAQAVIVGQSGLLLNEHARIVEICALKQDVLMTGKTAVVSRLNAPTRHPNSELSGESVPSTFDRSPGCVHWGRTHPAAAQTPPPSAH